MSTKPILNMIGGGFQHAFSSCGWDHPVEIVWDKRDHKARISVHIDDAIFGIPPDPSKVNVAWFCESPYFMGLHLHNLKGESGQKYLRKNFRYVFCSYLDYIEKIPFLTYIPPHARPWVEEKMIFPKSRLVSMIASSKNQAPGHKLRHKIAELYGGDVDLFGHGYKPVQSKNEGLRDYMFSFAIENVQSPGYFTEKITDCFATGTIPIYWGDPAIGKYFNTEGIVVLNDDFDGSVLSQEFYESKMSYIEENFRKALDLPLPEDYMYLNYLKDL